MKETTESVFDRDLEILFAADTAAIRFGLTTRKKKGSKPRLDDVCPVAEKHRNDVAKFMRTYEPPAWIAESDPTMRCLRALDDGHGAWAIAVGLGTKARRDEQKIDAIRAALRKLNLQAVALSVLYENRESLPGSLKPAIGACVRSFGVEAVLVERATPKDAFTHRAMSAVQTALRLISSVADVETLTGENPLLSDPIFDVLETLNAHVANARNSGRSVFIHAGQRQTSQGEADQGEWVCLNGFIDGVAFAPKDTRSWELPKPDNGLNTFAKKGISVEPIVDEALASVRDAADFLGVNREALKKQIEREGGIRSNRTHPFQPFEKGKKRYDYKVGVKELLDWVDAHPRIKRRRFPARLRVERTQWSRRIVLDAPTPPIHVPLLDEDE
jgi:hypothetical protein